MTSVTYGSVMLMAIFEGTSRSSTTSLQMGLLIDVSPG